MAKYSIETTTFTNSQFAQGPETMCPIVEAANGYIHGTNIQFNADTYRTFGSTVAGTVCVRCTETLYRQLLIDNDDTSQLEYYFEYGFIHINSVPFNFRMIGNNYFLSSGTRNIYYIPEGPDDFTDSYSILLGNRIYNGTFYSFFTTVRNVWTPLPFTGIFNIEESSSVAELHSILDSLNIKYTMNVHPITYRDTNCTHSGPDEATIGDTVNVDYTFPDGYGIVNPQSDIYVTNNGVVIPSSYANGRLTFTMPDPS